MILSIARYDYRREGQRESQDHILQKKMPPSYYAGEVVDGELYVVTGYAAATACHWVTGWPGSWSGHINGDMVHHSTSVYLKFSG